MLVFTFILLVKENHKIQPMNILKGGREEGTESITWIKEYVY